MMKNLRVFSRLFILLYSTVFLFSACSDDDSVPPVVSGDYDQGVFIINEGNFGTGNSAISFYYREKDSVAHNIFSKVNGRALGDVAQSMFIEDSLAYIIVNVSNKLEVVNHSTFKSKGGIDEGLTNPRYFTVLNDKGYMTNWGAFDGTVPAFIAVVDLKTLSVETKIETGNGKGSEAIVAIGNKLFFTNSFENTLGILDPATEEVKELTLFNSPKEMVVDRNGKLWIICSGEFGENNGKLFRVDPVSNEIEQSLDLGKSASKMVLNKNKDVIFYISGNAIYRLGIDATSASTAAWVTNESASFYGVGYDPQKDHVYASDANAFQGGGTVYRYDLNGELLGDFDAGVGPNGFVFK